MRQVSISYGAQSAQLREIRRADPHGQGRHSFTGQQQTLRRLNTVFAAFYERAKKGKAGHADQRPSPTRPTQGRFSPTVPLQKPG